MTDEKEKNGGQDTENVSIKGIQKRVYARVKDLARDTGKTVGDLTNDAFKVLLAAAEETKKVGEEFFQAVKDSKITYIQYLNSIEISGPELVKNNKKVSFKNIGNLTFKNMSEADFESYVDSIVNVKVLEIPKDISKFKVLERAKYIDDLKYS